jgi:hypothetical protein
LPSRSILVGYHGVEGLSRALPSGGAGHSMNRPSIRAARLELAARTCRFDSAHGPERQPKGFSRSAALRFQPKSLARDMTRANDPCAPGSEERQRNPLAGTYLCATICRLENGHYCEDSC